MPIMAPKVAFPAAFGIFIGTCLFKILIPDEELLILKGRVFKIRLKSDAFIP